MHGWFVPSGLWVQRAGLYQVVTLPGLRSGLTFEIGSARSPLIGGLAAKAQGVEKLTLTFCFAPRLSSSRS